MSLILEALRKSEAERRRGQAPDLRTELPPVAPPRAHALPRWSWAVFAVALLALAWLLLARPGSAPSIDALPAPANGAAPANSANSAVSAESAAAAPRDAGTFQPGPRIVIEPAPGTPPQDVVAAPQMDPVPPAPIAGPAIAGESGSAPAATADSTSAPPTPPAPIPPAAPTPPATAAPDARLHALSDLSTEERRQLPPLKLSMHMWSEDPARRFVILDGQRLAEGDRAGPAVVDAIRSDDVVLAWNGMRLRLSLR